MTIEVEAVLNNRPLTYVSSDASDIGPITPAHLLHGRPIVSLPHYNVLDDELDDPSYNDTADLRRSVKAQALLLSHFWSRWKMEYLIALHEFHCTTGSNIQKVKVQGVGDVLLIHNDTPRMQWKLAIIEGLNKGEDGLIRLANVRTSTGQTNQPIAKLYPLEVTAAEQPTMGNTREMPATPATQPSPQHRPP